MEWRSLGLRSLDSILWSSCKKGLRALYQNKRIYYDGVKMEWLQPASRVVMRGMRGGDASGSLIRSIVQEYKINNILSIFAVYLSVYCIRSFSMILYNCWSKLGLQSIIARVSVTPNTVSNKCWYWSGAEEKKFNRWRDVKPTSLCILIGH